MSGKYLVTRLSLPLVLVLGLLFAGSPADAALGATATLVADEGEPDPDLQPDPDDWEGMPEPEQVAYFDTPTEYCGVWLTPPVVRPGKNGVRKVPWEGHVDCNQFNIMRGVSWAQNAGVTLAQGNPFGGRYKRVESRGVYKTRERGLRVRVVFEVTIYSNGIGWTRITVPECTGFQPAVCRFVRVVTT